MLVIVINGLPGAGKDTFVEMISSIAANCPGSPKVFSISSVSKVKAAASLLGWMGDQHKTIKARTFLSELKDAWTRFSDGPFEDIKAQIAYNTKNYGNHITFVHIRELDEIHKVMRRYGKSALAIYVQGRGIPGLSNTGDSGASKIYKGAIVIDNSGSLEDLEKEALEFWEFIKKRQEESVDSEDKNQMSLQDVINNVSGKGG